MFKIVADEEHLLSSDRTAVQVNTNEPQIRDQSMPATIPR
jgi:hypothetical protein